MFFQKYYIFIWLLNIYSYNCSKLDSQGEMLTPYPLCVPFVLQKEKVGAYYKPIILQ